MAKVIPLLFLMIMVGWYRAFFPRGSQWMDLMRIWRPDDFEGVYSLTLDGPTPLQVILVKNAGGSHNRYWDLLVRQVDGQPRPPFKPQDLTIRSFIGSNDRIFFEPQPGIWAQRCGKSWQFLTYQDIRAPGPGPEVVPRSHFGPGMPQKFGEGYFTWSPGERDWLACDSRGRYAACR